MSFRSELQLVVSTLEQAGICRNRKTTFINKLPCENAFFCSPNEEAPSLTLAARHAHRNAPLVQHGCPAIATAANSTVGATLSEMLEVESES